MGEKSRLEVPSLQHKAASTGQYCYTMMLVKETENLEAFKEMYVVMKLQHMDKD